MNKITFLLNSKIVSLEAVYSACHAFLDKFYVFLDKKNENIIVALQPKNTDKINLKTIEGEFRNELLSNLLREKISQNNAKIREFIISQALYSSVSSEMSELLSDNDYQEDPLGIAIPWEEKAKIKSAGRQGKKKKKSK